MFLTPVSSNSTHTHYYGDPGWLQPDKSVAESNIETQTQNLDLKFMFSLKFSTESLYILLISPNHVIFNTILQ